ncbi:uncharacterized protein LOC114521947 [Dendronephthya gigantea]|uniref:uncharacterized protein LOC114521947 n=1 Tax=Dendronephthya gigantea TaxID=151771 RepID=UPI00106A2A36|nr:uncharacterized protein LOC114521947 [Dendronephthya gigantea]
MTNGNLSYHLSCFQWGESLEIVRSQPTTLAFSDLFVALLVQPVAIVIHALKHSGIYSCVSHVLSFSLNEFGIGLSYLTVCFTISFERLFAVCWPLKHRVTATKSILKRILFVQVTSCLIGTVIFTLIVSPKLLLLFQSRSIVFGTVFILVVYVYIFVVIIKRSRTMIKFRATKNGLKSVPEKTPENSVSQSSKNTPHTDSVRLSDPLYSIFEDSKCEVNRSSNEPRNLGKQKQRILRIVSQYSIQNPQEISPQDSHQRISPETATHDSGFNGNKIPQKKPQCPFKACAVFQKAMLKLKQELRVCKTMALVAGALVLCFLPRVVLIECATAGVITMKTYYVHLSPWIDVLAFANSSLNPYIYFFHNKVITDGVRKILFGKNKLRMQKLN